jgi:hypothetical protein
MSAVTVWTAAHSTTAFLLMKAGSAGPTQSASLPSSLYCWASLCICSAAEGGFVSWAGLCEVLLSICCCVPIRCGDTVGPCCCMWLGALKPKKDIL